MQKDNIMKSSCFFMDIGDILHLRFLDETGVVPDIILNVRNEDGTTNQEEAPDAPTALSASDITSSSFTANWNLSENTLGFYLDVATDSAFTALVAGYNNLDVGLVNSYSVMGLNDAYTYYYRLRGYNDYGTGQSSNIITTLTDIENVVDADGNVYTYVTIGTQQWMVQNLRTTKYADGTPIPEVVGNAAWAALITGAYCAYNNDPLNIPDYGLLYNWYAVSSVAPALLAPTGWRVPSKTDLDTLVAFLGGTGVAGGKLKEMGLAHWLTPNTGATNMYNFTALPSGYRVFSGIFAEITERIYLWASTLLNPTTADAGLIYYNSAGMSSIGGIFKQGYAVRCMRDA